jgi:hypothetical protein
MLWCARLAIYDVKIACTFSSVAKQPCSSGTVVVFVMFYGATQARAALIY